MTTNKSVLVYQPFHYALSGAMNDRGWLLETAMQFINEGQVSAAWRLLDRAEKLNPNPEIEFVLLRAKALEISNHVVEALDAAAKAHQSAPYHPEIVSFLLRLHTKLLPDYSEQAVKLAWKTLCQERDGHKLIAALHVFKQLQIKPVGACHYDGSLITGWMLDAPLLPAITVTIDGSDYKLTPFLATPFLHDQGFGSGHDGFSLRVPADQYQSIRIHLNGLDLAGSPIHLKSSSPSADFLSLANPHRTHSKTAAMHNQDPMIDIIVPVYKGLQETKTCLNAILKARNRTGYRIIVIDDASPEPLLVDFLLDLRSRGLIELIRQPVNTGFVGAVNRGLSLSTSRDVVLLNADTCVNGDWLDRLCEVAYQAKTIGTVTPLSNNGELLSFPVPMQIAAMPDSTVLTKLDADCALLGSSSWVEIPVGVGFCLFIKRCCLNDIGFLDDSLIERGYGDDTDLCIRATIHGWKNVCAPNVFVAHAGNVSFGVEKRTLAAKNISRIHERYPEHEQDYAAFLAALPLAAVYDHLQRSILPMYTAKPTKLVVLPAELTDRANHDYIKAPDTSPKQNAYFLSIVQLDPSTYRISLISNNIAEPVYLDYAWPTDDCRLWQDLDSASFNGIEIHALSGWPLPIISGLTALNTPYQMVLHDYSAYCLQNKLLKSPREFCGDAMDDATCLACISTHGCKNNLYTHPKALREFSRQLFKGAKVVRLASVDAMHRHAVHFPEISFQIDQNKIGNTASLNGEPVVKSYPASDELLRIAVFFAATPDHGFFKLLELSRLLAKRCLNIELIVFGETWDDNALLASGKAWLAGAVSPKEIPGVLKLHGCKLALQPVLWPEIDGLAWQLARLSGLPLAAPTLGIYAELLDSNQGDIKLPPDATVSEWLQTILLADSMATPA